MCSRALAGVDEAGRGPLAGDVVTAAVIFLQTSNSRINRLQSVN